MRRSLQAGLMIALVPPAIGVSQSRAPLEVRPVLNVTVLKSVLLQNYPNPFNPSTRIQYSLEKAVQVSLKVYNLIGREVATLVSGRQEAGSYTVPFNAAMGILNLPSGVYFYRLQAGSFVSVKRLVLIK